MKTVSRHIRPARALLLLALCLLLSGCYASFYVESSVPAGIESFVREYLETLRKGDLELAKGLVVEENVSPEIMDRLGKVNADLSRSAVKSVELVNHRRMKAYFDKTEYNSFVYQIVQEEGWLEFSAMIRSTGDEHRVFGMLLKPLDGPLSEVHAFTFSGKPVRSYVVLSLAFGSFVLIAYAAVLCVRTRPHRWWLWLLFILFGYGSVTLNWTTGEIDWHILSFWFLGGGALKSGVYGPWLVTLSFPIAAFLFIRKARAGGFGRSVGIPVD